MKKENLIKTSLAAICLSLGIVLPFLTMQIKEIGDSLLPMHFAALLCGVLCGKWYGLSVGFLIPITRSLLFSMPPMYPNAMYMAFEIATYGVVMGLLYKKDRKMPFWYIWVCLIIAQISGRIIWGLGKAILLGVGQSGFTFTAFIIGGFVDALPGIITQLILIPVLIKALQKSNFIKV